MMLYSMMRDSFIVAWFYRTKMEGWMGRGNFIIEIVGMSTIWRMMC